MDLCEGPQGGTGDLDSGGACSTGWLSSCSLEKCREAPEPGSGLRQTLKDNRGNGAALNKLMTTKFPASALLMELSCNMKRVSIRMIVEWAPREGNREADRLANGVFDEFDSKLGIPVSANGLEWEILPHSLDAGRTAARQVNEATGNGGWMNA